MVSEVLPRASSEAAVAQIQGLIERGWSLKGYPLTPEQSAGLANFLVLLNHWNRVHSLTAIEKIEDQVSKHVLDALAAWPLIIQGFDGKEPALVADIGSGMGVPGIVWALVMPQSQFDLIERQQKKAAFLTHVIARLGLQKRVRVVCQDVRQHRPVAPYDLIVSRAFAALGDFVQFSINLSGPATKWVAMTGKSLPMKTISDSERTQSEKFLSDMPEGLAIIRSDVVKVPSLDAERHLVWVGRLS